jgi:hypothetical protein
LQEGFGGFSPDNPNVACSRSSGPLRSAGAHRGESPTILDARGTAFVASPAASIRGAHASTNGPRKSLGNKMAAPSIAYTQDA